MNSTAFNRVFWKDWQQIQTPVFVVAALLCTVQAILIADGFFRLNWLMPRSMISSGFLYKMTLIVPFLMAAIVAGALISQERGRRTWEWSSSLPVPWYLNVISQFVNWLLALVITLTPMFALASVFPLPDIYVKDFVNQFANFLLIGLELVIWLSILMLVFKESVTGMMLGLAAFVFYEFANRAFSPFILWGDNSFQKSPVDWYLVQIGYILRSTLFILGVIVSICLFRWRWTSGQEYRFLFPGLRSNEVPGEALIQNWNSVLPSREQPAERKMVLFHALRSMASSQITLIAIVMFIAVLYWLTIVRLWDRQTAYGIALTLLYGGIFPTTGIMAFSPDQFGNRFRFMADRGVGPIGFAIIRIAIALSTATFIVLVAWLFYGRIDGFDHWEPFISATDLWIALWFPAIAVTSLGVFASLCFNRTPMAFVATCFAAGFGTMIYLTFVGYGNYLILPDYYPGHKSEYFFSTLGSVVATVTMMMFIIAGVRRWMIVDRFAGGRWFFSAWATVLIASMAIVIVT